MNKKFMSRAIELSIESVNRGTGPFGAVIVKDDKIIAEGFNTVTLIKDPTSHAEILTITESCHKRKKKFLLNTTLFVTLEPCIMCAAAISEAHISRVYFGAYDEKKGSLESIMKIYNEKHYFVPDVYGGINEIECSNLLKKFFQDQRNK